MLVAVAGSAGTLVGGPLMFNCDVSTPGGSRLELRGTFDGEELRTNIATWPGLSTPTELEGGLRISMEGLVHHYEWHGPPERRRLNIQMVEYSRERAAVLTIVQRYSDGRHSVDTLIGTGMCETRRGPSSAEVGQ